MSETNIQNKINVRSSNFKKNVLIPVPVFLSLSPCGVDSTGLPHIAGTAAHSHETLYSAPLPIGQSEPSDSSPAGQSHKTDKLAYKPFLAIKHQSLPKEWLKPSANSSAGRLSVSPPSAGFLLCC